MKKPIIGLTTYGRDESRHIQSKYYDGYFHVPVDYVDAIRRAGGVPVLLPPGEADWERWLDVVDGVVISGGADIMPSRYGGNIEHPQLTELDGERDGSEIALVQRLAEEKERPMLCICRGMQVFNVALGGTLYEHVPDQWPDDIHRGDDGGWAMQVVQVASGSKLAEVMGSEEVTTFSGHHQAVKQVAAEAEVIAKAPDGLVEALTMKGHPWLLAVQWHPEKSAGEDVTQQRLFDELVREARGGDEASVMRDEG